MNDITLPLPPSGYSSWKAAFEATPGLSYADGTDPDGYDCFVLFSYDIFPDATVAEFPLAWCGRVGGEPCEAHYWLAMQQYEFVLFENNHH